MATNSPRWNEVKERGGMIPMMIILGLYRIGGRWLIQFVLYFIVMWYWLCAKFARQASLDYLKRLHQFTQPNSPFSHTPNMASTYVHLMHFAQSILDKIEGWMGRVSPNDVQLFGHECLTQHYQKGLILIVSHFGNIELLRALKAEHKQKINVLVYHKNSSEFNRFLKNISDKAEINLIPVDELGLETAMILEDKLAQGEWVLIAADRVPVHSNRTVEVDFLGQPSLWPQGAWVLANLLKAPVAAAFCYRVEKHFEVHIHSISDGLNFPRKTRQEAMTAVTTQYVRLVEQHCLRAPYQWFNFYYFWNK